MKNLFLFLFASILIVSCNKDDIASDSSDLLIENRESLDSGCSISFLGYDENGCCIYQFNFISILNEDSKDGKTSTYITVNNRALRGSVFTVCESATVRLIRQSETMSQLLCSSTVECQQSCDIDVAITDNDDAGECCWIVTTTGVTNNILSIDGNEQVITDDIEICICADPGETIEVVVMDENGVVCFEDSVTCYECDECDQNYLSVSLSPAPPEGGMQCCYVGLKKEGPLYICDSGGGSNWVYPQDGVTITGLGGSPATVSLKICREDWAETEMTGWWDTTEGGVNICPRMEVDFDLADCN